MNLVTVKKKFLVNTFLLEIKLRQINWEGTIFRKDWKSSKWKTYFSHFNSRTLSLDLFKDREVRKNGMISDDDFLGIYKAEKPKTEYTSLLVFFARSDGG
jgi:hypothetical protein